MVFNKALEFFNTGKRDFWNQKGYENCSRNC